MIHNPRMKHIMTKRGSLKASVASPVTTPSQTQPDPKDVAALEAWKSKDAQEKASKELVDANSDLHKATEDSEANAVLADAIEIAEILSADSEFVQQEQTVINAKIEDDYKSIAMLKIMERLLPASRLNRLPYPGSTKSEVLARIATMPEKDRPNLPLWDKVAGSGGRAGTASYYKSLVKATPEGKKAYAIKEALEKENANALVKGSDSEGIRPEDNRLSDDKKATRAINQLMSAIRTAAKIRIQINQVKKLENIQLRWIREEYRGDVRMAQDADQTMTYLPGRGEVVKSTAVLKITNIKDDKTQRFSIGQFLRWKIDDKLISQGHKVTISQLISSGKTKEEPKPGTVPKSPRAVSGWTDIVESTNEVVRYYIEDKTKENGRYAELHGNIGVNTDTLKSMYRWFKMLEGALTPNLVAKAKEEIEKEGK